jgi:hypothetical protein
MVELAYMIAPAMSGYQRYRSDVSGTMEKTADITKDNINKPITSLSLNSMPLLSFCRKSTQRITRVKKSPFKNP